MDHQPTFQVSADDIETGGIATKIDDPVNMAGGYFASCYCDGDQGVTCPMVTRDPAGNCANQFTWNTSAIAPGTYWIVAVNNDPPFHVYYPSQRADPRRARREPRPAALIVRPDGFGAWDTMLSPAVARRRQAAAEVRSRVRARGHGHRAHADRRHRHRDLPTTNADGSYGYDWDVSHLASNMGYWVRLTVTDGDGNKTFTDSHFATTIFHNPVAADMAMPPKKKSGCEIGPDDGPSRGMLSALIVLGALAVRPLRRASRGAARLTRGAARLTATAEHRRAAALDDALQLGLAARARLAVLAVDVEGIVGARLLDVGNLRARPAAPSCRGSTLRSRAPTPRTSSSDSDDDARFGSILRAPQRLRRLDVADAGEDRLIEQRLLDAARDALTSAPAGAPRRRRRRADPARAPSTLDGASLTAHTSAGRTGADRRSAPSASPCRCAPARSVAGGVVAARAAPTCRSCRGAKRARVAVEDEPHPLAAPLDGAQRVAAAIASAHARARPTKPRGTARRARARCATASSRDCVARPRPREAQATAPSRCTSAATSRSGAKRYSSAEPIERRLERALLVVEGDAQIGLLGHQLGGNAVLLGADRDRFRAARG